MNRPKEPLYRRDNTRAMNYRCSNPGGDFRHQRNTKAMSRFEGSHLPMTGKDRGRDYTPLYKFLLAKVGHKWDGVYSEVVSRLDRTDPMFRMVLLNVPEGRYPIVRMGPTSYYSMLTVDAEGILVKVDPAALPQPHCPCCTHSFNGKPFKHGLTWAKMAKKLSGI